MKTSILDRFWAGVAPEYATKRLAAKRALEFIDSGYGNYGANTHKKTMRGWSWYGGSSKEDIEDNLDVLRQRSRDAYMGVPAAAAALKTMRTNVVAGGLMPVPQLDAKKLGLDTKQAERLQGEILREFDLWADSSDCDADGVDNFYALQQLVFLGFVMNGDSFATLNMREKQGNPYSLEIGVVEADQICSPDGFDRLAPCEVQGRKVHRIVNGVETDCGGKVIAYWIRSAHPLASTQDQPGGVEWKRICARGKRSGRKNIIHVLARERAGQVRGVPLLAPVIETLKQMGRYTEAEIEAAVISSMFTVFIQSEVAADARPFGETLPPDQRIDDMDKGTFELGTGAVVDLAPGEKVEFADPKHPNSGYDTFSGAMMDQIGAALEIPSEVLLKKFTSSYSAARGALNEFWRTCEMYRDWFAASFCQPVYEEWLSEAVARGRLNMPGFFQDRAIRKAYTACTWNGPARTNLNPVQEVAAAIERVNAGFSTAQEETAQMTGGNYARNMAKRISEAEMKRMVDNIQKEGQEKGEQSNG